MSAVTLETIHKDLLELRRELEHIKVITAEIVKIDSDTIKEILSDICLTESEKNDLVEALRMSKGSELLRKEDVFG
jgi:hypothetical protein